MTDLPEHLERLNPEQYTAVTTTDGPLLILAGAGSGKTRVLTRRVAHLLHTGVPPEHILAVTFTNKAAQEMKERVVEMAGEVGRKVWVSTFHSTCARILRVDIEALDAGWTKRFAIYDDDDQLRILKEIVVGLGYDLEKVSPKAVLGEIDHHKNRLAWTPDLLIDQRRSHVNDPLVRIWREYDERLKAADAVDFNDLIRLVVTVWRARPEVLAKWRDRFHYLLVDEYQDTNKAQYELLKLLAGEHRNLAVVGDDDQSIYGFRGADISNILGFERDFPDAKVIRLEQNYRCTRNILAVANAVVAPNTGRMPKKLWTDGDVGHKVVLIACEAPKDEAQRVARAIHKLRRAGHTFGDMAIIYRTNVTSRVFELSMKDASIPYRIVGGRKFYEHREIRDVLGYLRLVVNPADDAAFLRVVNVPTRGIGAKTLSSLRDDANARGEPLLRAARGRIGGKEAASKAISAFVALVDEVTDAARTLVPAQMVLRVLERTGYQAMLESEGSLEARGRLDNLTELVRDAATFEYPPEAVSPIERMRAWLDRIALAGQDDEIPEGGEVTLMTAHNAKGLEYPVVFVVHMMEGQFPHSKSLEDNDAVEEERRLAYVAFTRAMRRLVITRSLHGPSNPATPTVAGPAAEPSRFLYALPDEVCEGDLVSGEPADAEPVSSRMSDVVQRKFATFLGHRRSSAPGGPGRTAGALLAPPGSCTLVDLEDPADLREGCRVWVPEKGLGVVKGRAGASGVLVSFDGRSPVTIPLRGSAIQLVRD